jgi:hypothetical protein
MKFGRRGLSALAVVSLTSVVVASCSSGSETIRFVPSGGMANESAMSADAKMVWGDISYVVEGTLPEMPSEMTSYVMQKKSAPTQELQDIAKTFGLDGEAIEDPISAGDFDAVFKSYRIGGNQPEDEAMWMYGDGHWWSWSYYPGGSAFGDAGTSSDGSRGGGSGTEMPEPPSPPNNLPSKNEVESLTQDLLSGLGVNASGVKVQAFSDEWSAWSQVNLLIDDLVAPISWYFSFGENGKLLSASGSMVDLKKSKTYTLADATEAVSRLGDYRYYGGYGAVEARDASISSSSSSSQEEPSAAVAEPVPVETDVVTPDTTVDDVQPIEEVPPVDETLVDVQPEKITITITSVAMSYTVMYEENGTQTLMPAFTYSNKQGEVGTVVALSDDLFAFEEVTDTTVDGGEPKPEPGPEPGANEPIPAEKANTLVGLTEDEAMKTASSAGWEFRIAARDGEQYMLTTDYVMNRVNVTIVEGIVTEVTVG